MLSLSQLPKAAVRLSSRMLCFLCGRWRGSNLISASISSSSAACTFFMLLILQKTLPWFQHTGAASICQYRTKYGDQICTHSHLSAFCCWAFYFSTFQCLAFTFWFSSFWYRPLFWWAWRSHAETRPGKKTRMSELKVPTVLSTLTVHLKQLVFVSSQKDCPAST